MFLIWDNPFSTVLAFDYNDILKGTIDSFAACNEIFIFSYPKVPKTCFTDVVLKLVPGIVRGFKPKTTLERNIGLTSY